jgi:hypothetical protein
MSRSPIFYARLKNIAVAPSDCSPCRWQAEVVGDFTVAEHNEAVETARDLQRRFSLRSDPLKDRAELDVEEPIQIGLTSPSCNSHTLAASPSSLVLEVTSGSLPM